jgi:hypothetical protein
MTQRNKSKVAAQHLCYGRILIFFNRNLNNMASAGVTSRDFALVITGIISDSPKTPGMISNFAVEKELRKQCCDATDRL